MIERTAQCSECLLHEECDVIKCTAQCSSYTLQCIGLSDLYRTFGLLSNLYPTSIGLIEVR